MTAATGTDGRQRDPLDFVLDQLAAAEVLIAPLLTVLEALKAYAER